jgi:hypothetical protein
VDVAAFTYRVQLAVSGELESLDELVAQKTDSLHRFRVRVIDLAEVKVV